MTENILSPDGYLTYDETQKSLNVKRNFPTWRDWLGTRKPFVVQTMHPEGYAVTAYTARCEQAQGKKAHRWYGYKRTNGKLVKRYLGRSDDLTWEVLQEATQKFVGQPLDRRDSSVRSFLNECEVR